MEDLRGLDERASIKFCLGHPVVLILFSPPDQLSGPVPPVTSG